MTTRSDTPSLRVLAESLAGTFPGSDDAPLARALLRKLACGEPVSAAMLASAADRDEREVSSALARWPNVRRDEQGRVVAFGGLSLRPTEHRFAVAGRQLYTWCAWDTLFVPELLNEQAHAESTCPVTGAAVRLTIAPGRVIASQPADVWVSFPPPEQTSTDDIIDSFCCHVHFLAEREAAARWLTGNDGALALSLDDAFALGRLATRALAVTGGGH
jgi:alkylmercury lyase